MQDELLAYYKDDLEYLRKMGKQFGEMYPEVASKLALEPVACNDPHVERLLEGFAFLAARVRKKIDDEFPEITEALLNVVYPHFLRPIPSFSVIQFELDPTQGGPSTGLDIDRASVVESRPLAAHRFPVELKRLAGERCRFSTVYPVTLWPVTVTSVQWTTLDRIPGVRNPQAVGAIRVQLSCMGDLRFSQLEMDRLCFYLNGPQRIAYKVYELLGSRLLEVIVRDVSSNAKPKLKRLPPSVVRPMGFSETESALPFPGPSFDAYRLLQEYFCCPEKFLFIEINGLKKAFDAGGGDENKYGNTAELVFLFSGFEGTVDAHTLQESLTLDTFSLGCTPIVNLFTHVADGIEFAQTKYEYPVIPDTRRPDSFEVFSIDEVYRLTPNPVFHEPFFGRRRSEPGGPQQRFWIANRQPSIDPDDSGTDVVISLVDLSMEVDRNAPDSIDARLTCTNRNLPELLPFRIGRDALEKNGSDRGDLMLLGGPPEIRKIILLKKPTRPIRVVGRDDKKRPRKDQYWRLISHLSLNYVSLLESNGTPLKQLLRLYDFEQSSVTGGRIDGIVKLETRRESAPVFSEEGPAFVRGIRVDIEFDEMNFVNEDVYLFASVLEHFLGLYTSLNSYTRLCASSSQRKEILRKWEPRAGQRVLA
jgi:type VI secretion system protein ImpG